MVFRECPETGRKLLKSDALTHFWLHEVDSVHMPRQWLRTALYFLQRFHRVNDGTPADNQLGTYLFDVDLMLSADKNLVPATAFKKLNNTTLYGYFYLYQFQSMLTHVKLIRRQRG